MRAVPRPLVAVGTLLVLGLATLLGGRFNPARSGDPTDPLPPGRGRIRVTVTDAPGGKAVPVMASPRHAADGSFHPPAQPIDLTGQWDSQGTVGARRMPNLPAPWNGPSWCVDGEVALEAAPGPWEVRLRRGLEFIPQVAKLDVQAGQLSKASISLKRWEDMRPKGWWSGDDHVHAQVLNDAEAARVLAWARAEDTHVVNVVKMGDIHRTWFEQRGWGVKNRHTVEDFALIPGQEDPRTHDELGHTLALNLGQGMVRDVPRYYLYDLRFDGTRAQGGLNGYAHVNSGIFFVHRDMSLNVPRGKVDFVELLQFGRSDPSLYYEFLNLAMPLTALAGSDVPWGGSLGEARAYAYTGKPTFDPDAWYDAVKKGKTFVTNGPMIELLVDDAHPGETVDAGEKGDKQVRVRARAWGHPAVSAPLTLEVVRFGEVIRSAKGAAPAKEGDVPALTLEFTLPAGQGCWLAARATGTGGGYAHTGPVWVVRKGLRPWKYEAVGELLAKRAASLKSIEELYDKRKKDRPQDPFVTQWPELQERVAAAHKIYDELRETAAREKALR